MVEHKVMLMLATSQANKVTVTHTYPCPHACWPPLEPLQMPFSTALRLLIHSDQCIVHGGLSEWANKSFGGVWGGGWKSLVQLSSGKTSFKEQQKHSFESFPWFLTRDICVCCELPTLFLSPPSTTPCWYLGLLVLCFRKAEIVHIAS